MKKEHREIFLCFLINATNNICTLWGHTFPYIASYFRFYNENVTMNYLFACSVFLFVGNAIANFILPYCFRFLGIRFTFLFGALLYMLNCFTFFSFTSIFWVGFNAVFAGVTYQFIILTTNLFFFEKYPDTAKRNVSIAVSGGMFANLFFSLLLNYIVNPNNSSMDKVYTNGNGVKELFFDFEIAQRISYYMKINGVFTVAGTVVAILFLENPSRYVLKLFQSNSQINADELGLNNNGISEEYKNKNKKNILSDEDSQSFMPSYDSDIDYDQEFKDEMKGQRFWLIYFICMIRMSVLMYFIENYKVIGLYRVKDDIFINKVWAIATVCGFVANFMASFIWTKLGYLGSYYFSFLAKMLLLLLFLKYGDQRYVFGFFGLSIRYLISINRIFNYYSIFDIYSSELSIRVSRVFDTVHSIGFLFIIVLNYYFVNNGEFGKITVILLIFCCIGLVLSFKLSFSLYSKKKEKTNKSLEEIEDTDQ